MRNKAAVTRKKDPIRKKGSHVHARKNISGVSVTTPSLREASETSDAVYRDRAEQLIALLDEWAVDESGEQETTWEQLKSGIDGECERLGMRRLFDG
jgi:hypothetical protein